MARRARVVRIGIPALLVGVLALIALWRVGLPADPAAEPSTTVHRPGDAITLVAEVLSQNAIGRSASLKNVEIRRVITPRTFWIATDGDKLAFAVLDADVRHIDTVRVTPGAHVNLTGLVRPAPDADRALRQWGIDEAASRDVAAAGTYLHVTEIGAAQP